MEYQNSNTNIQKMEEQYLKASFQIIQKEWIYGQYTWTWKSSMVRII